MTYSEYLASYGWRLTKWLRKRSECQQCGETERLELHHKSYKFHNAHPRLRMYIPNMSDPMETLCRKCHAKAHK